MPQMLDLVQGLIDKGYAYAPGNGDVYYEVRKKDNYGKHVAHRNLDDLETGARVGSTHKKIPRFCSGKQLGLAKPYWDSLWGKVDQAGIWCLLWQ